MFGAPRHAYQIDNNCNFITHSHLRAQMHATSFRLKQKQSRPAFVPFGLEAWLLRGGMWFQKSHVVAQKVCSNSDNGLRGVFSLPIHVSHCCSSSKAQSLVTCSSMRNINRCGSLGGRWDSLSDSVIIYHKWKIF